MTCDSLKISISLTPKEYETLCGISERFTRPQGPRGLWIGPSPAKYHLGRILEKLVCSVQDQRGQQAGETLYGEGQQQRRKGGRKMRYLKAMMAYENTFAVSREELEGIM